MWNIIVNSLILAAMGTVFLRLAGRKSLSQMTTPQIVILLSIGAILGSEAGGKGIGYSLLAAATFIAFLVAMEFLTLHWNRSEKILKGKSVLVISEGQLVLDNLKKLRMSVDDLEKRLRIAGISSIRNVKTGTIEDNGEYGYELMPHAQPVTRSDLELMLGVKLGTPAPSPNIFTEVSKDRHDREIPPRLQ
ncbi:DUF421 domain-containing protein [Paenibacillus sp. 32352]|uniref:DUF421 domain-containing protein n=1 Tax=Paenibacillus sp. 32352 TaxID=1969111 RepID=UPI0009ADE0DF|nr:YetF domain-containing protein [Paenibacillus sp. 32352]